ncbi:dTDP-4-dehydrorhamnose 3,5-epimerase [bacterium]|nr:dTDP-4-dehydrorhamnose 3,5-epimerase [bacterium]MCP5461652.1 dTDP-4-dehydrorhamnose 3,5-epimerase [bacterium]
MGHTFIRTSIPEVIIIEPDIYKDHRGFFAETYRNNSYCENGINQPFVQDNHSHSKQNVLRGLHYQLKHPQGKLVTALTGEIFDVAVDIRRGSPTFGKWIGVLLNSTNKRQLWIPSGFAHGFYVISQTADVLYKCTGYYVPEDDFGIRWDSPELAIDWHCQQPILSDKDRLYPTLKEMPESKLPVYHR